MKLLVFWTILFCVPVFAQRGVSNYTRESGLTSNYLTDVTYDDKGFLWIATNEGIDRFDGQRFIHFRHDPDDKKTICYNHVTRIAFDPKGYVWAGTMNGGLIRISTRTLLVRNYFYDKRKKNGVADNRATEIFIDSDNETWICQHYFGMDLYNPKTDKFTNYRPTDQYPKLEARTANLFSDVIEDRNDKGIFWCASLDGLLSFNKHTKKWRHYPVKEKSFLASLQLIGFENSMRCLEQDGKGNLYIGTWGGGLLYFDKNQGVYKRYLFEGAYPPNGSRNNISDLKWRDTRYLYVCASAKEFLLFDTKTKEFIHYDEAERSIIRPVRMARYGRQIAVAGIENGVFVHNESLIFGELERYPFVMQKMAFHPSKEEWLATNPGNLGEAYFFSNGRGKNVRMYEGKREEEFFFLQPHYMGKNGYVIVASDRILSYNPAKGLQELASFDQFSRQVRMHATMPISSWNDGDSVLWIGTKYGGILHYSFKTNKLKLYRKNPERPSSGPFHNSWIFSFASYGNILYYGTEEGIGAIDLKTKRFFMPGFAEILPHDNVRTMVVDKKGLLWVGTTANGLLVIDVPYNKIVRRISDKMGLQTQRVDQLIFDRHNHVWALTPQCVAIVDRKNYKIQSLENQNGMSGISTIVPRGNNLYFLQYNGFVKSRSGSRLPHINRPKPYIQRVRELNDQPFVENKTVFAYDENNLGFEFGVLDYSNSTNNFVSYRLKGLERNWQSGNGKDEVAYYNLPGGHYAFQVRMIEDGRAYTVSYDFEIIPPFWKQWWFILVTAAFFLFSIWWYMRVRIRRVESTERMRTEFNRQINEMESKALRAQMNPHFLFNSLNSIRLFILKNEVESASDYIAKFSKLLRMILNYSRQDMITVYDEIQTLKLYLEFERLRFDGGFEFDLQIDGQEVLDCHIPPMIIQPFVENAIWHGLMPRKDDKGYIHVSFRREDGLLLVSVRDNGIGRQKARENKTKASLKEGSVGLQITKERLRTLTRRTGRLNEFQIIDLFDDQQQPIGTLVKLSFEIEEK